MTGKYTRQMIELFHENGFGRFNTPTEPFYKTDGRMSHLEAKQQIAVCDHGFEYVSEMIFYLNAAGFSNQAIGDFLDVSGPAIHYQLKQMGVKPRPRGGYNGGNSSTGVTGVYKYRDGKRYIAQLHKPGAGGDKWYFGVHDTLLQAVIARRFGELKHGYPGTSKAQAFIMRHRRCDEYACNLCGEYKLDHLPLVCLRKPNPVGRRVSVETFPEFLDRARGQVLKQFKIKG